MDYRRAEEIFHSKSTVEVYYDGGSVWIEELHPENGTVDIRRNNSKGNIVNVNPADLREGKIIN